MDQQELRGRLEEAAKTRGRIAVIARESEVDQRTVRAFIKSAHPAHAATIDKLAAYFRKVDRRAKA